MAAGQLHLCSEPKLFFSLAVDDPANGPMWKTSLSCLISLKKTHTHTKQHNQFSFPALVVKAVKKKKSSAHASYCLSVCSSVCLCLSVHFAVHLPVRPSVRMFRLPVRPSVRPSDFSRLVRSSSLYLLYSLLAQCTDSLFVQISSFPLCVDLFLGGTTILSRPLAGLRNTIELDSDTFSLRRCKRLTWSGAHSVIQKVLNLNHCKTLTQSSRDFTRRRPRLGGRGGGIQNIRKCMAVYATSNVTKYQVPFLYYHVMRCLHQVWRVLHQAACVLHQAVCYLHQLLRVCCHLLCFTH